MIMIFMNGWNTHPYLTNYPVKTDIIGLPVGVSETAVMGLLLVSMPVILDVVGLPVGVSETAVMGLLLASMPVKMDIVGLPVWVSEMVVLGLLLVGMPVEMNVIGLPVGVSDAAGMGHSIRRVFDDDLVGVRDDWNGEVGVNVEDNEVEQDMHDTEFLIAETFQHFTSGSQVCGSGIPRKLRNL